MTRTKTLWAILFSIMVVPSCNHWRKIDIDARDSSLQYAFTLVTEEKKHCVIRENNVLSIITGVKDNQAIYQQLDDKSQDTVKLVSLIQRILDKGEFTVSRPFHSDSLENYLLKQDAPHMHFALSNNNNSILAGRKYTWYYTHDKELEEVGLRNIAIELDGIFTRLENILKSISNN